MGKRIATIGFDADDTLWHNENLFEAHHRKYCELLSEFHDQATVEKTLFRNEMKNLELYGYGIKSFTLSSIETAIELTGGAIGGDELKRILEFGKDMLAHPVELLDGVEPILGQLAKRYRLVILTKGDLRDQERKIAKSGLSHLFDHAEVVSEKSVEAYARALKRARIRVEEFLMVGNSLKSDILPVLDLGGKAAHIPYRITWQHEQAEDPPEGHERFYKLESIAELPKLLQAIQPGA